MGVFVYGTGRLVKHDRDQFTYNNKNGEMIILKYVAEGLSVKGYSFV